MAVCRKRQRLACSKCCSLQPLGNCCGVACACCLNNTASVVRSVCLERCLGSTRDVSGMIHTQQGDFCCCCWPALLCHSAVLLVDTATPGWVVRYANSGWQTMVQRCMQSQATRDWVNAAASPAADQSSSQLASEDGTSSTATASTTVRHNGMPRTVSGRDIAGNAIVGMLLWPMVEEQLSRDPDRGSSIMQQLQQLLLTRQPFTLHGLELPGLEGATASFVFRCVSVAARRAVSACATAAAVYQDCRAFCVS